MLHILGTIQHAAIRQPVDEGDELYDDLNELADCIDKLKRFSENPPADRVKFLDAHDQGDSQNHEKKV